MAQVPTAAFDLRPVDDFDGDADAHAPVRVVAVSHPAWQVSIHTDLESIEGLWRTFQKSADGTVFQTYEWLSTWQRYVGSLSATRPFVAIVRDVQGKMLALIPLGIESGRGRRTLTWLGTDLCDYNAPLLVANFSHTKAAQNFVTLWQEILRSIRACDARFDLIALSKMPERVGDQANPFMQLKTSVNPSGAYRVGLAADWDTFYKAKRSATSQKRDRTKRRKLGESGDVVFVTATETDDIARSLETLMTQKAGSFAHMGVPNIFDRPGWADFYRAVATDPASRAITHVSRLEVGAVHAAMNMGLTHRGTYYHVLASYEASGEISKYGPGASHLQDLMRHAIEHGDTMFDFTIGDEPYKREWSDEELTLHDHAAAAGWRGALLVAPMRVKLRVKRWIKQTPVLWRLATRTREIAAKLRSR